MHEIETIWPITVNFFELLMKRDIFNFKENVKDLVSTHVNNEVLIENKDYYLEILIRIILKMY